MTVGVILDNIVPQNNGLEHLTILVTTAAGSQGYSFHVRNYKRTYMTVGVILDNIV